MYKSLRNLVFIALFLAPSSSFGMEPEPQLIKIKTNDDGQFNIEPDVAKQSETLKKMLEDIEENAELPLPEISKSQFTLLIPAMQELAKLHIAEFRQSIEEFNLQRQQLTQILYSLHPQLRANNQLQGNMQFIYVPGVDFSDRESLASEIKKREQQCANKYKELQSKEAALMRQFEKVVADLKSNGQPLDNKQLIEFFVGVNYLDIPFLGDIALKALGQRTLSNDEWLHLGSLGDKLKNLWHMHPAKRSISERFLAASCEHQGLRGLRESKDGKTLISWSSDEGTIKLWDKNHLRELKTLEHPGIRGLEESETEIISWGGGFIKIWDRNNLQANPKQFEHEDVSGFIESHNGNLVSWSDSWSEEGATIKIWDKKTGAELKTLAHKSHLSGVKENDKYLVSWSSIGGTVKIWDKSDLDAEPKILEHERVSNVDLSGIHLISRSPWLPDIEGACSVMKIWLLLWDDDLPDEDDSNWVDFYDYQDVETLSFVIECVDGFFECSDGKQFITWSSELGTIGIWDKGSISKFIDPHELEHQGVIGVKETRDGNFLFSWSQSEGTIKIWNKKNLEAAPLILKHPNVFHVTESTDGLISFCHDYKVFSNVPSWLDPRVFWVGSEHIVCGNILIWKRGHTQPFYFLQHPRIWGVRESRDGKNLISWSGTEGTIISWDVALMRPDPTPEQAHELLAVHYDIRLPDEKLSALKEAFPRLNKDSKSFDVMKFIGSHKCQLVGIGAAVIALFLKTAINFE